MYNPPAPCEKTPVLCGNFFYREVLIQLMLIDINKLRGNYIYLELLASDHKAYLQQAAKDDSIWEFTKEFDTQDNFDSRFDTYFATALDRNAMEGQQAFVIRSIEDNAMIGMTRFYEISEKDKRLSIGHTWYIPAVWGKIYNKECKLLLLQYTFEALKYNRVGFSVAHQNIRSQKAVEKIGGVKEGILRKYGYRNDGILRDRVMFSIIDDEWPAKKEKLARLMAENENH
jgi:N-acetyltransferase